MWWKALFRRKQLEQALEDENNSHLEMEAQQRIERRESPSDAHENSRKDFGNVDLVKDVTRDTRGRRWLDEIRQDLFRAPRVLSRQCKLTATAIFSLSIAMTLGVVTLSVGNTFLLLPPSGANPDRLVTIYARLTGGEIGQVSYPDYKYFRENNRVFTDIAAAPTSIQGMQANWGTQVLNVIGRPVSDNYFSVMGIRPYIGRLFSPGDDNAKPPVAVMTYSGWKRLGADPNIIGKVIGAYTIVGVTPKEFTGSLYGVNGDILTSFSDDNSKWFTQRDARRLLLIGRLKPRTSRRQAQAEMSTLSDQLASAYPKEDKDLAALVSPATQLAPEMIPTAQLIVSILMTFVVLVLLIACANVANLLLAVAVGRRQEAAIKLALGVQRGRLIREFLTESMIVCSASAVLAYVIAAGLMARYSLISIEQPMVGAISVGFHLRLDATVVIFTAALVLIAIFATGLAPALYASSPNLAQVLSGEIVGGGTRKSIGRNVLVIAQVAACTLVLVGMGLCERSLYNLRHSDTGVSGRNIVAVWVGPPEGTSETQGKNLYARLRNAVSALPGVESVSLGRLPLENYNDIPVQLSVGGKEISVTTSVVDNDYFTTIGMRMLSGRTFSSADDEKSPDVVVINRTMAETFWPGQDAVGKSVLTGTPPQKAIIIGVAATSKYGDLGESGRPAMYYALNQHYQPFVTLIAKASGDPRLWIEPIDKTKRSLNLGLFRPITFNDWINSSLLTQRITAWCVAALSALALLLAIVGLFGAISYSVSERKKEFGIRVALGAQRSSLLKMVLRQTFLITGAGVVIGILLGVGATILLRSQFYGISSVEWTVLLPVSAAMLAVALLVAYLSARPWVRVDPMEAVRHA
jgi:predicted permease